MPVYFIDINSDGQSCKDEDGAEYADFSLARRALAQTLTQVMRDAVADQRHYEVAGRVRDADGRTVGVATLSLRAGENFED